MCPTCRAQKRVRQERGPHDVEFLAKMLAACHMAESCCSLCGRSLHTLRKIGESLTVDRINPARGYVPGNVQLLAKSLNEEKKHTRRAPQRAVEALLRRLDGVTDDILSDRTGAYQES
jgi:hypothetical protein